MAETAGTEEAGGITALDWVVIVAGVLGLAVLLLWAYRGRKSPGDGQAEG